MQVWRVQEVSLNGEDQGEIGNGVKKKGWCKYFEEGIKAQPPKKD